MFWIFSIVTGLGFILTKVGAYSVWVNVLSLAVKVLGLLLALVLIFIMWDKVFRNRTIRRILPENWLK